MVSHALIAGLLCILILLSGCTAFEQSQESLSQAGGFAGDVPSYTKTVPAPASPQGITSYSDNYRASESSDNSLQKDSLSPSDQKIIRTADISLEVTDVQQTLEEISRITKSADGLVQSSSVSAGQNDQYSGTVTIRIPFEKFDEVLNNVKGIGKLTSSSVSSQDVTEEYIDLTAQKTALENQLAQYNRIMTQTVNVSEILGVQREIERVQVELDRIVGRMKYMDSRISFSTLTIRLSEPPQVVTSTGYSIASVISEGISGFTETVVWLVVLIMTLLPILILGILGYVAYQRIQKKKGL